MEGGIFCSIICVSLLYINRDISVSVCPGQNMSCLPPYSILKNKLIMHSLPLLTVTSLILAVFYTAVAEWREFSYRRHSIYAQTWLIFCQALVLGMVFEYVLVYVLCGSIRDKLRRLCGASTQGEVKVRPLIHAA